MNLRLAIQVIEVPRLFEKGDKSTACLLKEAGFPATRTVLNADDVEAALRADPELTSLWLKRGSDQRIAGGWGIEHEKETYRVQSFDGEGQALVLCDRHRAVAEFIVRYARFIGDVQARVP